MWYNTQCKTFCKAFDRSKNLFGGLKPPNDYEEGKICLDVHFVMVLVIITTLLLEKMFGVVVVTVRGQYLKLNENVQFAMGVVTQGNYLLVVGIPGLNHADTVTVQESLLKRIKGE